MKTKILIIAVFTVIGFNTLFSSIGVGYSPIQPLSTLTSVTELTGNGIPNNYAIEQNYPNPFNPSTIIRYGLPYESNVKLEIYNITGRKVQSVINKEQNAGYYQVDISFNNMASGIYFYVIDAKQINGEGKFREAKKMLLVK